MVISLALWHDGNSLLSPRWPSPCVPMYGCHRHELILSSMPEFSSAAKCSSPVAFPRSSIDFRRHREHDLEIRAQEHSPEWLT